MSSTTSEASGLPTATIGETIGFGANVVLPTLAKGVIIRRPAMVSLAERWQLDRRAIRYVQRLRGKYRGGPLLLRLPRRFPYAVVLAPEHVHHVLNGTPEPFRADSREKRTALGHFAPQGVLSSHGAARSERRRFNEQVLDTPHPIHRLADRFVPVIRQEAEQLLEQVRDSGELAWKPFFAAWFKIVRRIVFGDGARDDTRIIQVMEGLRRDANWAFFHPRRRALRAELYRRLDGYLQRAEAGSLASVMAGTPQNELTAPAQQVPQWLFAYDPAGIATFRALALLATHPEPARTARQESAASAGDERPELPFLRACVLDALRLWPTTPLVLRQSTEPTVWENGVLPRDTGLLIFSNFFHRDELRIPYANRFAPELWLDGRGDDDWPLIPFSAGPAICPGRYLVLLTTSTMLATLLRDHSFRLKPPQRLNPALPLPATLDHFSLQFAMADA